MDIIQELYYDFNYNLFLIKIHMPAITLPTDRVHVNKWLKKLITSNKTVDEMKLRNDFMHYLALSVYTKNFDPPFNESPPCEDILELVHLLPGGGKAGEEKDPWEDNKEDDNDDRPMIYSNSPDGGAFLAAQPIPRHGTFCYLAVVSRAHKSK